MTQPTLAHLKDSDFEGDVETIAMRFDGFNKHAFSSDTEVSHILFGTVRDKAPKLGINHGRLKVDG